MNDQETRAMDRHGGPLYHRQQLEAQAKEAGADIEVTEPRFDSAFKNIFGDVFMGMRASQ